MGGYFPFSPKPTSYATGSKLLLRMCSAISQTALATRAWALRSKPCIFWKLQFPTLAFFQAFHPRFPKPFHYTSHGPNLSMKYSVSQPSLKTFQWRHAWKFQRPAGAKNISAFLLLQAHIAHKRQRDRQCIFRAGIRWKPPVLRKEPQFSHGLPVGLDFYIESSPQCFTFPSPFILHSKPAVRFLPDRLYLFSVRFLAQSRHHGLKCRAVSG